MISIDVTLDNRFTFFEFIISFPKSILRKDFNVNNFFIYCKREMGKNWNYSRRTYGARLRSLIAI